MNIYCHFTPANYTPVLGVNQELSSGGVFYLSTNGRNSGRSFAARVESSVQKSLREYRYSMLRCYLFVDKPN